MRLLVLISLIFVVVAADHICPIYPPWNAAIKRAFSLPYSGILTCQNSTFKQGLARSYHEFLAVMITMEEIMNQPDISTYNSVCVMSGPYDIMTYYGPVHPEPVVETRCPYVYSPPASGKGLVIWIDQGTRKNYVHINETIEEKILTKEDFDEDPSLVKENVYIRMGLTKRSPDDLDRFCSYTSGSFTDEEGHVVNAKEYCETKLKEVTDCEELVKLIGDLHKNFKSPLTKEMICH